MQDDNAITNAQLRQNLQRGFAKFMDALAEIVKTGRSKVGDYTLDQISFKAEIGAKGEFKLLGTGAGISGSAGVTFTLHRQSGGK